MEKTTIDIRPSRMAKIDFQDQTIFIDPYISMENKNALIQAYIDILMDEDETKTWTDKYITAEYVIMGSLIEFNTSIDTSNILTNVLETSGLWNVVRKYIENYDEFRKEIETVVKYVREDYQLKNSTSVALNNIIAQISTFVDRISQIDLSKEGVSELLQSLDNERNEINKIIDPSKVAEPKTPRKKKEILQ